MADGTLTIPVVSQRRQPVGEIEVPAVVVAGPVREHLLFETVRAQRASRRAGTVATKTRGLVSGGGKKPWRQKGTGRARAGSSRSPLWAGGGTIFGPQPRDHAYRLPRSARRAALRAALASRYGAGALTVVDRLSVPEAKTKRLVEVLRELGLEATSVLVVLGEHDVALERAGRNLPRVRVLLVGGLTVYDVLGHAHLLLTRAALEQLVARLATRREGTS
jgi:large subunit ribosomal protein L4